VSSLRFAPVRYFADSAEGESTPSIEET